MSDVPAFLILLGLCGLPLGVAMAFGTGFGIIVGCLELIGVGFAAGYDSYVKRQEKPNA